VKFPWQSLNFWNSQKKGANHAPPSSVHNSESFGNSEKCACDRKIFTYFSKKLHDIQYVHCSYHTHFSLGKGTHDPNLVSHTLCIMKPRSFPESISIHFPLSQCGHMLQNFCTHARKGSKQIHECLGPATSNFSFSFFWTRQGSRSPLQLGQVRGASEPHPVAVLDFLSLLLLLFLPH